MKSTVVLLFAMVALVGATGGVAAASGQFGVDAGTVWATENPDEQSGAPPWPGNDTTTGNDTGADDSSADDDVGTGDTDAAEDTRVTKGIPADSATDSADDASSDDADAADDAGDRATTTSDANVSPGQQLAGAVGAQGASVQGELWNRSLSERLANATSADERAEVIADEAETIDAYVEALEDSRENITEAWAEGEMSEGEYRASLSAFVIRAYSVEHRANRTARAAERLPAGVAQRHGVNATRIWNRSEQARELYQFEEPIAQEVANETLSNQSALADALPEGEQANRTRSD